MGRFPTVPAAAPRKRASRKQPRVAWVYVEPVPTPLASPEQATALVAEQARQAGPRQPPRRRPTRACTVGAGFYPKHAQRVPLLRRRKLGQSALPLLSVDLRGLNYTASPTRRPIWRRRVIRSH